MLRKITLCLIVVLLLSIIACGQKGPQGPKKLYTPPWFGIQNNPDYVYLYGKAVRVNENVAFDAARSNAFLEAAEYVKSHVKGLVKNYVEEAGVENPQITQLTSKVVKNVSKANFSQALVSKRDTYVVDGGKYKTFVRLSVPKNVINKNMLDKIKKEKALYNQFKASQAFNELEYEIEKTE